MEFSLGWFMSQSTCKISYLCQKGPELPSNQVLRQLQRLSSSITTTWDMFSVLELLSGTIQASSNNCISLGVMEKKTQGQNQTCGSCGQLIHVPIATADPSTTFRSGELLFPKVLLDGALSRRGRTESGTFSWVSPSNTSSGPCLYDTWYVTRSETLSFKKANVHKHRTVPVLIVKQLLVMPWDKSQCLKTVGSWCEEKHV